MVRMGSRKDVCVMSFITLVNSRGRPDEQVLSLLCYHQVNCSLDHNLLRKNYQDGGGWTNEIHVYNSASSLRVRPCPKLHYQSCSIEISDIYIYIY